MLKEKYHELHKENSDTRLERYLKTKTMQRLKGKGFFCGLDYVGIKSLKPVEYYSRFDHCKNIGYTASKLTDELKIMLAGLFHDTGTLSFAHVNSFKKGQALTQESDELSVKKVLLEDEEILTYLHEDGIDIDDVCDCKRYSLIDKDIPALCLDRLDGILVTCLFWSHTHSFEEIRNLYYMITYFENLNGIV